MDKDFEVQYHSSEEKNWWFVSRREAIINLLTGCDKSLKILDIGCAGGALALELTKSGYTNVFGLDYSEAAVRVCLERGIKNITQMDGHNPAFEDESFDILISSDSLEHLEFDQQALENWNRILKPNGKLYLFVPAFNFLWSAHDDINFHYRRYSKKMLLNRLESSGFKILRAGFWNFAAFFPTVFVRLIQKLTQKKQQHSDQLAMNKYINVILTKWMSAENIIFKYFSFPIGVSAMAIAQKTNVRLSTKTICSNLVK